MNHEKFIRRNQLISSHLSDIAKRHASVDSTSARVAFSPAFRDLLVAQERLLLAAERLLDNNAQRIAA